MTDDRLDTLEEIAAAEQHLHDLRHSAPWNQPMRAKRDQQIQIEQQHIQRLLQLLGDNQCP